MSKKFRNSRNFKMLLIVAVIVLVVVAGATFVLTSAPSPKTTTFSASSRSSTSSSVSSIPATVSTTSESSNTFTVTNNISGLTTSSLGQKFIEIKAFDATKGGQLQFVAGSNYSAIELLTLIENIHSVIGNFNLIRFIRTECEGGVVDPNLTASQIQSEGYSGNENYNWNGTLNTYFTAIQQAAGGQIIPDADMDVYFGQTDCAVSGATQQQYQQWYYQDSASLLTLSAIANGQRFVMLESWDAYYDVSNPTQSSTLDFFQNMLAQGWKGFIPQVNNPSATGSGPQNCAAANDPFVDFGYAGYVRNGIFWVNTTSPYVFPHYNAVCSLRNAEPYIKAVLLGIESQQQNGPSATQAYCDGEYDSAMAAFASCLSQSERESALASLAENQTTFNYIFIYPVLVGEHSVLYNAQEDGTLSLIEQLMNQFNP